MVEKSFVPALWLLLMLTVQPTSAQPDPIALHPSNPHYFTYKNKPTVLITSGEHYGVLVNESFDYVKYLSTLSADKLNLTRVFSGAYIEPAGAFGIERNTLVPAADNFVAPWARSQQPGYAGGGNKFDLTHWNDAYFRRLKAFMQEAEKRNIVVEFALFCPFYENVQWAISPMHPQNNINDIPEMSKDHVYTLDHNGPLLAIQEALVVKLVNELNGFGNLIFEICNEPYFGGVTMAWQHHIASLIEDTEKALPNKHLISQNIANGSAVITDPHPGVSVFNFHYATPPYAVAENYHLNKVIGDNETGFNGQADSTYRKEGWEIILAGGALYNNLDYSFVAGHEDGTFRYPEKQPGGGSVALRQQLSYLKTFIEELDFVVMKPDRDFTITAAGKTRMHLLSEKGKQYAAYILQGNRATITLPLPKGTYRLKWVDPATGKVLASSRVKHTQGARSIESPSYPFDIAFSLVNRQEH